MTDILKNFKLKVTRWLRYSLLPWLKRKQIWYNNTIGSTVGISIITSYGIILGAIGSIYSREIKLSTKLLVENIKLVILGNHFQTNFSGVETSLYFISGAIIFGVLYAHRQRYGDALLSDKIIRLTESLETMPPKHHLDAYKEIYNRSRETSDRFAVECRYFIERVYEDEIKENQVDNFSDNLEKTMRLLLDFSISVIKNHDNSNSHYYYGANIMMYQDVDQVDSDIKKVFVGDLTEDIYVGYLVLILEFSTNSDITNTQGGNLDDKLSRSIALPIPKVKKDKRFGKRNYVQGAPEAFLENALTQIYDTSKMAETASQYGNFQSSVIEEMREYFESNNEIKSIISIPLSTPSLEEPIGVLNFHRDHPIDKELNPPIEQLLMLMTPIVHQMVDCLMGYDEALWHLDRYESHLGQKGN